MNLLEEWKNWEPKSPPYILESDREFLQDIPHFESTWEELIKAEGFGLPTGKSLHLGLYPVPFLGDLQNASVYILLLNPGVDPNNYFAEYEVPAYRKALQANLKQDFRGNRTPFLCLDPQFSWHGGYNWWHKRLYAVIEDIAQKANISFAEARMCVGNKIACIEAFPYHSVEFNINSKKHKRFPSVSMAREFVMNTVLPRVQEEKAILIIPRSVGYWDIDDQKGVIKDPPRRSVTFSLKKSLGGPAIRDRILFELNIDQ